MLRLRPGATLWIDRRPPSVDLGDIVFFPLPEGGIGLGQVDRFDSQRDMYWVVTDDERCPGRDSDDLGWIPAGDLYGRLLMAAEL